MTWIKTVPADEAASEFRRRYEEALRRAGFDDRAVLQITLIAAWFNYINRVADALGVGR
jgi:alkylhydroperoxidase family enzyme